MRSAHHKHILIESIFFHTNFIHLESQIRYGMCWRQWPRLCAHNTNTARFFPGENISKLKVLWVSVSKCAIKCTSEDSGQCFVLSRRIFDRQFVGCSFTCRNYLKSNAANCEYKFYKNRWKIWHLRDIHLQSYVLQANLTKIHVERGKISLHGRNWKLYCVDSMHALDPGARVVNPKLICISHHHRFFCFLSLCCLCAVLPCLHSRLVFVFILCGATCLVAARVQCKQHSSFGVSSKLKSPFLSILSK